MNYKWPFLTFSLQFTIISLCFWINKHVLLSWLSYSFAGQVAHVVLMLRGVIIRPPQLLPEDPPPNHPYPPTPAPLQAITSISRPRAMGLNKVVSSAISERSGQLPESIEVKQCAALSICPQALEASGRFFKPYDWTFFSSGWHSCFVCWRSQVQMSAQTVAILTVYLWFYAVLPDKYQV